MKCQYLILRLRIQLLHSANEKTSHEAGFNNFKMVTHVDQRWNSTLRGLQIIDKSMEKIAMSENNNVQC